MSIPNSHLVEVNCGFHFNQETTPWDSTFFGRFYEKIYDRGFTQKEVRRGVSIIFGLKENANSIPTQEIEEQFIFKNSSGMAITMAQNKISFHITSNYSNWETFVNTLIRPISEIYKKLGLGNGERECNLVYLNRFSKSKDEDLSEYFKIISKIDKTLGDEANTFVQRVIDNGSNNLITKLKSQLTNNTFNINFECGAVNKDRFAKNNSDWIAQANMTHAPIRDFFESLITEKLKKEL